MNAIEKRARELLDSSRERAVSRKPRLIHMDDAIHAIIAALTPPEGHVVVTRNEAGQSVAVTRQDDEGRILSVIAEFAPPEGYVLVPVEPTEEMQDAYRRKCLDIDLWESLYVPAYKAMIDARPEVP